MFWTSAVVAKRERLKQAEAKLLQLAREFGDRNAYDYKISTFDTKIPRGVVPLKPIRKNYSSNVGTCMKHECHANGDYDYYYDDDDENLRIHAVRVESTTTTTHQSQGNNNTTSSTTPTKTPLVLLHGYMNAAAYFYRNLVGLTHYFETVYSLDMLGWGLSSRPDFDLVVGDDEGRAHAQQQYPDEISATEAFFVESLEAWRRQNHVDKMILAGHSMGGYMSVAYCEKYPQHVERLILLSPVGVPEETMDIVQRRRAIRDHSWKFWALSGVAETIFTHHSAGKVFRGMLLPVWRKNLVLQYVQKRLVAITDPEEQRAVADYLVANNSLPGSGEHCLNKVLNPYAFAKRPTEFRIPHLNVPSVTFVYGDHDWMDPRGGIAVQLKCQYQRSALQQQQPEQQESKATITTPQEVSVYQISNAGHLLMLENYEEFNAAVILGAGGSLDCLPSGVKNIPRKLNLNDFVVQDQSSSLLSTSQQQQQQKQPPSSLSSSSSPLSKPSSLQEQHQRSSTASLSDTSITSTTTEKRPQIAS